MVDSGFICPVTYYHFRKSYQSLRILQGGISFFVSLESDILYNTECRVHYKVFI